MIVLPARRLLLDHILHQPCVDRVQPRERLVDHDQVWLVDQGRNDLGLLLHAFAQVLDALVPVLGQIETLQPIGQAAARGRLVQPFERRQIDQGGFELQITIQAALLRHIADAVLLAFIHGTAEDRDLAHVRPEDIQHHADGRGLACAVGPQQSEDLAWKDLKGDVGHGQDRAEGFF